VVPGKKRLGEGKAVQVYVEHGESKFMRFRDNLYHRIILSIDLGDRQDHTAFVVTETRREMRKNKRGQNISVVTSTVRDIQQLPLNIGYDVVAERIHKVFWDERLRLRNPDTGRPIGPTMLVDAGGVGDAICDDFKKDLGVPFVRYKLVRGTATETRHGKLNYTIPRTVMFQQLYAAFHTDRIRIDRRLRGGKVLLNELKGLQVEQNEETGYVRVVHREGEHDDVAISLAAANWWANRKIPAGMRSFLVDGTVVDSVHGVVRKGSQYPEILQG
jgi:hypothetical protein